jgi:hypothetical protein
MTLINFFKMRGIDVSEPQSLINLNYTLSLDDASMNRDLRVQAPTHHHHKRGINP